MIKKNIKTPALARKAELNAQTLYNYFSGKSELTAGNLEKVFTILDISVS